MSAPTNSSDPVTDHGSASAVGYIPSDATSHPSRCVLKRTKRLWVCSGWCSGWTSATIARVGYRLPRRLTRSVERGTRVSDPELELADAVAE